MYPTQPVAGVIAGDLSWLSGIWRGQHGADAIEEHWSKPAGGTLMGMFRWLRDEQVWFYELMTIEPRDDEIVLHIKHFDPGLKGWEEKDQAVEYVLVEHQEGRAVFVHAASLGQWLIYHLETPERLVAYFETEDQRASLDDLFVYWRQNA